MRLIDADELKENIKQHKTGDTYGGWDMYDYGLDVAIEEIDAMPTVDVKRGRWEIDDEGYVRCSNCHQKQPWNADVVELTDYCCHCGAQMENEK